MSDTTITERQQFWLDHFHAADTFDGSLAEYARSAGLKPKELYQWKTLLVRRGLLAGKRRAGNGNADREHSRFCPRRRTGAVIGYPAHVAKPRAAGVSSR
jgi:hypothetical protein